MIAFVRMPHDAAERSVIARVMYSCMWERSAIAMPVPLVTPIVGAYG